MLTDRQKEKLKANWGEKANSLQCKAEVRLYDDLSKWECYIYSMNPDDEDEVEVILTAITVQTVMWRMSDLSKLFNEHGEAPKQDLEYVPRKADELLKKLKELHWNQYG